MVGFWCESSLDKESCGKIIYLIRKKTGLTATEVAEKIKVSPRDFSMAEVGRGAHVFSILEKLCDEYKLETTLKIEAL